MVVFAGRLSQQEICNLIKPGAVALVRNGGVIRSIDNIGFRAIPHRMYKNLLYHRYGTYMRFRAHCTPVNLKEFERLMKGHNDILRCMTRRITDNDILGEYLYFCKDSSIGVKGPPREEDKKGEPHENYTLYPRNWKVIIKDEFKKYRQRSLGSEQADRSSVWKEIQHGYDQALAQHGDNGHGGSFEQNEGMNEDDRHGMDYSTEYDGDHDITRAAPGHVRGATSNQRFQQPGYSDESADEQGYRGSRNHQSSYIDGDSDYGPVNDGPDDGYLPPDGDDDEDLDLSDGRSSYYDDRKKYKKNGAADLTSGIWLKMFSCAHAQQ